MKLIVLGNGFDLFHKLPTSYYHFKEFLENNHHDMLCKWLGKYINGEWWYEFEESLANLNFDEIELDHRIHGDDDSQLEHYITYMAEVLMDVFYYWVKSININTMPIFPDTIINNNNFYINFNYTLTLEKLYKIAPCNILHIHGDSTKHKVILGHSYYYRNPYTDVTANNIESFEEEVGYDEFIEEEILEKYYSITYKNTSKIIKRNVSFFDNLHNAEKVIIMGHSLGDVDLIYFKKNNSVINNNHIQWIVTYYKKEEINRLKNNLLSIGICEEQIILITMKELYQLELQD